MHFVDRIAIVRTFTQNFPRPPPRIQKGGMEETRAGMDLSDRDTALQFPLLSGGGNAQDSGVGEGRPGVPSYSGRLSELGHCQEMTWRIGDQGCDIVLSNYAPKLIGVNIQEPAISDQASDCINGEMPLQSFPCNWTKIDALIQNKLEILD
jgi:hypothetical protein